MTVSEIGSKRLSRSQYLRVFKFRAATLILLGVVVLAGAIAAAWFAGEGTITDIFARINQLQESPPLWISVPMVASSYLVAPAVVLWLVVQVVTRVSPQPKPWSQLIVVGILLVLTVRYVLWRSLATLNLSTPLNGVFSLALFVLEMLMLTSSTIQLALLMNVRDRKSEADQKAIAVQQGQFTPSVDVLIPTYDEPAEILRRTVVGCQAMTYPNKRIYLLDDTRRPEIQQLAQELGCEYMTRPDNRHAKAGNLNHALPRTFGELIVVFDADFVPTKNFLLRTVGFFQDEQVALVQTPQSFYNADPIARNLGLENVLTPEEEIFYRFIQPMRDGVGSVICSGTSFVVRRKALMEIGCFVTESLSEDYFTGIRLAARGYRQVYLDEKLSAGLAAENMAAHATQRLRWARGTLQAFFIESNPLTIRGLSPIQRLAHFEGLLHWFTSLSRVGFLLFPLAYSFLGVIPLRADAGELLFFFLPYYLVQLSAFAWLNRRSRSALLSDIYAIVLCVPLAITAIEAMFRPFAKGFKVTPKGTSSDRFNFNWPLALPLVGLFLVTAVTLWRNIGLCLVTESWQADPAVAFIERSKGMGLGWIWSAYNLIMLGIALLTLLDAPRPNTYEWFDLRRTVRLRVLGVYGTEGMTPAEGSDQISVQPQYGDPVALSSSKALSAVGTIASSSVPGPLPPVLELWGMTTMLSEVGAEVALTQAKVPLLTDDRSLLVQLDLMEEGLSLRGYVIQTGTKHDFPIVKIAFEQVTLDQHRRLIEMLFCRPGQWRSRCSPTELQSLLLLFQILFKPKVLFDRRRDVKPIAINPG